jgi:pimeloyl-ACP methyl ester carboxylesterase
LKIKKYVVEVSNNTMTDTRPAFVFVHGAWNSAAAWHKFIPLLEARGYVARALDLPGAGARANAPSSYDRRPLDAVAFASEPSPNASVTQEDRARAVIALVEDTRRQTGAPFVLVGHSLGGLTVTAVAETIPEQLHAVVYLCAYMVPPGMSTNTIIQDPSMSGSLVRALIKANPKEVGAIRIDWRSEDSDYREQLRLAFAGDVSPTDFAIQLIHKHCDEPVQPFLTPSVMTAERFGRVPRHYFRTLEDRTIPIAAQDFMISSVDIAMGNLTHAHTFATSHAPYSSQPDAVAETLLAIAGDQKV